MPKEWRPFSDECVECGDGVEVYTDSGEDNFGYDGDQVHCVSCLATGYLSVDEGGARVCWHED